MASDTKRIRADHDAVKEILKERKWSQELLSEKIGLPSSTLCCKFKDGTFTPTEFKLMCMVLGKAEGELLYREPVQRASGVIAESELCKSVAKLQSEVDEIKNDLVVIADALVRIEKLCAENKAQSSLNAEEINAISTKTNNISSLVNKISGHIQAKWHTK